MAQLPHEMTISIETTDELKAFVAQMKAATEALSEERIRDIVRQEIFKWEQERQLASQWAQLEIRGQSTMDDIDYSRWNEFMAWVRQDKRARAPQDAVSRSDLIEKLNARYMQWLKQQQKPAHLDFEVK